jgi:acyl dehydratase
MSTDVWQEAASTLDVTGGKGSWSLSLPPVTMTQMAYYCAATGVRDPIHYDRLFAREMGFRDAVANGSLRLGWLAYAGEALTGPGRHLVSVRCQHRGPLYVGDDITMQIVVEPSPEPDGNRRKASLTVSSPAGVCDVGEAIVEIDPKEIGGES